MTDKPVPPGRTSDDPYIPRVARMTPEERREFVEHLSHEIARWSAELNRRLS